MDKKNKLMQETGDLVELHRKTIEGYASRFLHKYPTITAQKDDLIGWGVVGLIKAYQSYDSTKGATINTWVSRNVFLYMYNGLNEWHGHTGGFPRREAGYGSRPDEIGFDDVFDGYEPSCAAGQPEYYARKELVSDICRLPKRLQRILVMRFWGDKSLKEIARIENCSGEYARQLEARAIKELRTLQRHKNFRRATRQYRRKMNED